MINSEIQNCDYWLTDSCSAHTQQHYNLELLTSGHFTGGSDEMVMKW